MKMRTLVIFLLLHLALISLCAAQVRPDGKKEKLRGPVHTIQTESAILFQAHNPPRHPSRTPVAFENFDTAGNLTESVDYEKVALGMTRTLSAPGVYASSPNDVDEEAISLPPAVFRTVNQINDKGRVEETDRYDASKALIGKILYSYDAAGRRIEMRREEKNKPVSIVKYRCADDGRLIQVSTLDDKGAPLTSVNCDYLYDVVRIESKAAQEKGSTFKMVRMENQGQKKADLTMYPANRPPSWKWNFTYDDRGNVIGEEFVSDLIHEKWAYAYEFDAYGNWTTRTKSRWFLVSGKPQAVAIEALYRTITYYPKPYERQGVGEASEDELATFLGDSQSPSEWLERARPDYPIVAQSSAVRGIVVVEVTVDEEGNVTRTRIASGHPMLSHSAEAAAKRWKFKPTLLNGVPVKRTATLAFDFSR